MAAPGHVCDRSSRTRHKNMDTKTESVLIVCTQCIIMREIYSLTHDVMFHSSPDAPEGDHSS